MRRPAPTRLIREWVEDYYLPMYRYAYHLAGTETDAEDLTQEAFCAAQMNWQQLRDPGRARPWLFAILRNAYLRKLRDHRLPNCVPLDDSYPAPPETESSDFDPNELRRALNDLPESHRTPVILFYFENFTYRDIADQMNVPIGTVMSRLSRSKAFLRERLMPNAEPAEARS